MMEMEEKRMAPSTVKHWRRGVAIGGGKARNSIAGGNGSA
jgi:hypothetical protein